MDWRTGALWFSTTQGGLLENRDIDLSLRQVPSKCQERGTEVGRKEMSWLNREAERPETTPLGWWDPALICIASWTSVTPGWILQFPSFLPPSFPETRPYYATLLSWVAWNSLFNQGWP